MVGGLGGRGVSIEGQDFVGVLGRAHWVSH
jgi:hypothetical protein